MAVIIAISLPALAVATAVAVDIGIWQTDQLNDQRAADAAAFSAGVARNAGDSPAGIRATARAIAAQYGLMDGAAGVTVTVNTPPASGAYAGNPSALEVIVRKPENLLFAWALARQGQATTVGRAVAGTRPVAFCALALDPTASEHTANLSHGAHVTLGNCGFAVDGASPTALHVGGGAALSAAGASVVGEYAVDSGGRIVGPVSAGARNIVDPYASVRMPTPAGCPSGASVDYTAAHNGPITVKPGVFCGGLYVAGNNTIYLNPGVYFIVGTPTSAVPSVVADACGANQLCVESGATVQPTPGAAGGVTIILTGGPGHFSTMNIVNGGTLVLTAPTVGDTAGIAVFGDRAAPATLVEAFSGGSHVSVTGALYFPSQTVSFGDGVVHSAAACTQLIGYDLLFTGGMTLGAACENTGVAQISGATVRLLE